MFVFFWALLIPRSFKLSFYVYKPADNVRFFFRLIIPTDIQVSRSTSVCERCPPTGGQI